MLRARKLTVFSPPNSLTIYCFTIRYTQLTVQDKIIS